jgi:hypothetical protein
LLAGYSCNETPNHCPVRLYSQAGCRKRGLTSWTGRRCLRPSSDYAVRSGRCARMLPITIHSNDQMISSSAERKHARNCSDISTSAYGPSPEVTPNRFDPLRVRHQCLDDPRLRSVQRQHRRSVPTSILTTRGEAFSHVTTSSSFCSQEPVLSNTELPIHVSAGRLTCLFVCLFASTDIYRSPPEGSFRQHRKEQSEIAPKRSATPGTALTTTVPKSGCTVVGSTKMFRGRTGCCSPNPLCVLYPRNGGWLPRAGLNPRARKGLERRWLSPEG